VIAEVAIICLTVLAALYIWVSVPLKELKQSKAAHDEVMRKMDDLYKETKALHSLKDEVNSMKVSLGWTK
jgi:hypothetical protein